MWSSSLSLSQAAEERQWGLGCFKILENYRAFEDPTEAALDVKVLEREQWLTARLAEATPDGRSRRLGVRTKRMKEHTGTERASLQARLHVSRLVCRARDDGRETVSAQAARRWRWPAGWTDSTAARTGASWCWTTRRAPHPRQRPSTPGTCRPPSDQRPSSSSAATRSSSTPTDRCDSSSL